MKPGTVTSEEVDPTDAMDVAGVLPACNGAANDVTAGVVAPKMSIAPAELLMDAAGLGAKGWGANMLKVSLPNTFAEMKPFSLLPTVIHYALWLSTLMEFLMKTSRA